MITAALVVALVTLIMELVEIIVTLEVLLETILVLIALVRIIMALVLGRHSVGCATCSWVTRLVTYPWIKQETRE